MANPLKRLMGETAVYGVSTILARIVNFLLVPLYTRCLTTSDYGTVTEFMAYIAVLQVVLILGLETGSFRFANREGANPAKVYANAFVTVFGLSAAFLALMLVFARPLAGVLGYSGHEACVRYMGGILAFDSITAILFAKLRQEHKAVKFVIIKTLKILTECGTNLLLFLWYPGHDFLGGLISSEPDFSYVIFAIFVSSVLCALLLLPDMLRMSYKMDKALLGKMLLYSLPLMASQLPGVANDFLDRILFRHMDTSSEAWRSSLGVFQAAVKLSVIMNLFIQVFRFASEPFFFQRAQDRNSKELYAAVMEFFVGFCGFVFLGVVMYADVLSLILGRDFRAGMSVVPIMLMSYILLGMNFNVSMWYKLSDRSNMAIWITLAGLAVTLFVNVVFMPKYSYTAAAWGHLASYAVMFIISAILGAKYYPIPYRWPRIALILCIMGGVWLVSAGLDRAFFPGVSAAEGFCGAATVQFIVHTMLLLVYVVVCVALLRPVYRSISKM